MAKGPEKKSHNKDKFHKITMNWTHLWTSLFAHIHQAYFKKGSKDQFDKNLKLWYLIKNHSESTQRSNEVKIFLQNQIK